MPGIHRPAIDRMRGGGSFWDLSEISVMSDAAPVSLCVADGLLWIGRSDGRVMAWDGTRVAEALDLGARGVATPGELRGMANRGERLYVGYEHPVEGASLLCRQPSSVSGAAPGLSGCRDGWVMECGAGVAGEVSALGVYQGTVLFARDAAGAATIYERRLDAIRPSGEMVLSVFDGGEPEVSKVLRGCWVLFEPLREGESVRLSYSLDGSTWTLLAAPVTVGLTSAHCGFPPGSARRVWLKVELLTAAADLGPALTGLVLEYSDCVDTKRRWRFQVRCEGVPGVPLRLLDGSVETLTGAELSESLWDALSENIVSFDDLDGYGYTVWLRSLKEDVGKLPQSAGVQTVATVELAEC